jgi:uncharacterized protein YggE
MNRIARPALLAVTAALILAASPLGAQMNDSDEQPVPSITVNGSGEVRMAPDEAVVRLGVVAQSSTARQAQQEVNRTAQAILEGMAALGIPEKAIQTSQLVLSPVYDQPGPRQQAPSEPRIVGYRASNVVSVRLTDLAKVGPAIDAATESGANQVQGVDFQLRDDLEARQKALAQAVEEARAKARTIASALGVDLGPVLDVQEGGISIHRPQLGGTRMLAMEARTAETPVAAGEVTISANVTLRYRIGAVR